MKGGRQEIWEFCGFVWISQTNFSHFHTRGRKRALVSKNFYDSFKQNIIFETIHNIFHLFLQGFVSKLEVLFKTFFLFVKKFPRILTRGRKQEIFW